MTSIKIVSNVLLQTNQLVFGRLSVYIITSLQVLLHVDLKWELHGIRYLLTKVIKSLDVEYLNFWLMANLCELFCLSGLTTFLAFVLIVLIELSHSKAVAQARLQVGSMGERPALKRLISHRVMVTTNAGSSRPFKAWEVTIYTAWVQFVVFLVDLTQWSLGLVGGYVSIELLRMHRCLLSLKLIE